MITPHCIPFRRDSGYHLLRIRHFQTFASYVMIVSNLKYRSEFSSIVIRDIIPSHSCHIRERFKRHIVSEIILSCILIPFHKSVFRCAPKRLIALIISNFAGFCQMSYPQHRVVLVTSAFLTLSALHNIVRQTSVVVPLIEKCHRFVIETFVIQKDTERHKSLDSSGSPVAVCIRRFGKEVSQYRNKYVTKHILPRFGIRIRYRRISMSHQFSGISKKKSLQSSAQGSIIITHINLT